MKLPEKTLVEGLYVTVGFESEPLDEKDFVGEDLDDDEKDLLDDENDDRAEEENPPDLPPLDPLFASAIGANKSVNDNVVAAATLKNILYLTIMVKNL